MLVVRLAAAPVVRDRRVDVAGHLEQVRANGVEPIVAGDARVGVERVEPLEPRARARRPSPPRSRDSARPSDCPTCARAARRAPGSAASRCPRRAGLRRARRRSRPAADTGRPIPSTASRVDERDAFGDRRAIPQRAILLGRAGSARRPAPVRAAGARRSAASARAGRRPRRRPAADRAPRASGGSLRSTRSVRCRCGAAAARVALVEDQIEDVQHRAQPLGALASRSAC